MVVDEAALPLSAEEIAEVVNWGRGRHWHNLLDVPTWARIIATLEALQERLLAVARTRDEYAQECGDRLNEVHQLREALGTMLDVWDWWCNKPTRRDWRDVSVAGMRAEVEQCREVWRAMGGGDPP